VKEKHSLALLRAGDHQPKSSALKTIHPEFPGIQVLNFIEQEKRSFSIDLPQGLKICIMIFKLI